MKTRVATMADIPRGMEMFDNFHAEGSLSRFPINPDKLMAFMGKVIQEGRALLAVDDDGKVVGVLALSGRLHFFSDTPYMGDVWFYVDKDYRKTRAAFMLMRAAVNHAKQHGMPLIMSVTHGTEPDRKDRLFEMFNFTKLGGIYAWGF